MVNEIIVDVGGEDTRVALLEDGELVEIYIERPDTERLVGNIYRGKVCSVLPGMQAAFIDIGYEKNAFLYVSEAVPQRYYLDEEERLSQGQKEPNIEDILKPGQEITVQVIKEPIGTKGPRVSTHITLPGRHLVLLPKADYIGVSRRIEDEGERAKLKKYAEAVKPADMGLIVRTASEGLGEEAFSEDADFLEKLWNRIKEYEFSGKVPRCIYRDLGLIYRTVRDLFTSNISKFIINSKQEYIKVIDLVDIISPSLKAKITYYSKEYDLFEYYGIETHIMKAMSRKIWLKSGGYLILDQTEALSVIDVNTGKYIGEKNLEETVLKTNLEAAKEIAKHLRLRDIGGIIIIDFIDMNDSGHKSMVIDELKQALKRDRTKTSVIGITGLGLVEMTRKKVRQGLSSFMNIHCPYCAGTGRIPSPEVIAHNVEKQLSRQLAEEQASNVKVQVHPAVAAVLERDEIIEKLGLDEKIKIFIESNIELKYDEIKISNIDNDTLVC